MFVFLSGFRCEPGEASRTPQVLPAQTSPARGQGVPTGNLSFARATHTATLLPNGRVLIAGGMEGAGATAEIYDPDRGSFAPAGRLAFERSGGHAAVLLSSGKVLLAGGCYFGTSDRFWLNLQAAYDLDVERDWLGKRLEEEVVVRRRADQFRAG
jgi:hypothetical protein